MGALMDWWPWLAAIGGIGGAMWLFPVLLLDKRAWLAVALVAGALYMRHHGIKTERARHEAEQVEIKAERALAKKTADDEIEKNKRLEAEHKIETQRLNKENTDAATQIKRSKATISDLSGQLIRSRVLHAAAASGCPASSTEASAGGVEKANAEKRPAERIGDVAPPANEKNNGQP